MARSYSSTFKKRINTVSTPELPLLLLEISHTALSEPARVVNDNDDFPYSDSLAFVNGKTYALNDIVVPTTYNGRYYKVTVGGVAAGVEPTWPTVLTNTVVSGAVTFRCEGYQYKAVAFRAALPDDKTKQMPRARLAIDNVGKELASWLELSGGGEGAQVRIMQVLRSAPAVIEWEVTLDLVNLTMNHLELAGDLGFEDLLGRSAVALNYRPEVAPGLF